jgi:CubicO group peptidase (beta-lactamase class C family)
VAGLAAEVDSLAAASAFSGAVLLDKGGQTLFWRAAGMASREQQRPNRIDTRFDLGSINKIFTHVAILQLESQGKLNLDDTLDRYLPDYPKRNGRRITLRMLIDHRAGVPDVLEVPALWQDPARVRTIADWYRLIRDAELRFEPGTKQEYSNGGYILLGAVIERASGEDYYRYVHDHIYAPAGMAASESDRLEDHRDNTATPYSRRVHGASGSPGAGEAVANRKRLGRGSSAGGGYSTAGDLVRFARAMRAGKLLDAQHRNPILGENAGLGIAGGSPGVNALLVVEGPYTLVVLANVDPPAAERFMRTTGRQLARLVGGGRGPRQVVRAGGGH